MTLRRALLLAAGCFAVAGAWLLRPNAVTGAPGMSDRMAPSAAVPVQPVASAGSNAGDTGNAAGIPARPDHIRPRDERCQADNAPRLSEQELDERLAGDLERRDATAVRLAQSEDPDHRLAAVLIGRESASHDENVGVLSGLVAAHPQHRLALWALLGLCADSLEDPRCSDGVLTAYVERTDAGNGEAWAMLAVHRARRGENGAAQAAMQRAAGSPVIGSYYPDFVALLERAYRAGSDFGITARLIYAIGDSVSLPSPVLEFYRICDKYVDSDMNWRQLCYDYARVAEAGSRSILDETMAIAIQRVVAESTGDTDLVAELDRRRDAMHGLLVYDEDIADSEVFNARFLEELVVHGERGAMALYKAEVERRRAACAGQP